MKQNLSLVLLCCVGGGNVDAFVPWSSRPTPLGDVSPKRACRGGRSCNMAASDDSEDRIAALRAAAAKAREDADRLRQELGEKSPTATATPAKAKVSLEELQSKVLPELLSETTDLKGQVEKWTDLKDSGSLSAFGTANLRSFPVSLSQLESRTGLTAQSLGLAAPSDGSDLDDFKYATLFVTLGSAVLGVLALALLPENIGATVCYLVALVPVLFLGIGSTAPGIIADAIAKIKGGGGDGGDGGDGVGVSTKDRICRHEAAHFCCGYWCGLPVEGYSVGDDGVAKVEFGAVQKPYNPTSVAALTVTALAGCVGEALKWPSTQPAGGSGSSAAQDLMQLETVVFRQSQQFMGAVAQQDMTRWGALTAALLLRQYASKYEEIVKAFERQAELPECIAILES